MEIVIPPRDHEPSTYRYTWDENGEVQQVTRVRDENPPQQRLIRGRQTVQWPFQSIATETELSSETATLAYNRPVTWAPKRMTDADSHSIEQDLIPDYVRNYLRGETPETVARRKRNGGKLGERGVDVAHQHQYHQSRVADFEGFLDVHDVPSRIGSSNDGDEHRYILPGSREKQEKGWRRFTVGWRAGVALNALLALFITVVGLVLLIFAVTKEPGPSGKAVIFSGSCTKASAINWGLRAAISVLVVVLLAGANYVFQVLSSPTRAEVAAAHFRRKWLDIGIPSFRNMGHIEGGRVFLASALLVSAAFIPIIYNASIFTSQTTADYKLVLVTESFLTGAQFSNDTTRNSGYLGRIEIIQLQQLANRGDLKNITAAECFHEFGGAFSTVFSSALVITNIDSQSSSVVRTAVGSSSLSRAENSIDSLTRDRSSIQYCLARPAQDQRCDIVANGPLLGAVLFLNVITIACVVTVLFRNSFEPLAALGDAISSFLKEPDMDTRGCCLLSKVDVWQGRWGLDAAKYWVPRNHYWIQSVSLPRWLTALFIWVCCAGCAVAALAISLTSDPSTRLSPFGTASPFAVFHLPVPDTALALIASLPQLLLFALYLTTNSILTIYHLSHESSVFAIGHPRPLRVSSTPEGVQTTSLYLTLPRPYSWILLLAFIGLSFTLSQSIFPIFLSLSDTPIFNPTTGPFITTSTSIIGIGLSSTALLIYVSAVTLFAILVVALGFRRAPPAAMVNGQLVGNPMTLPSGSCSAVISARCHTTGRERDLWARNIKWGTVREGVGMEVSHGGFSAGQVSLVDVARSYA